MLLSRCFLLGCLLLLLLPSCGEPDLREPTIRPIHGQACTVFFRRDILGQSSELPGTFHATTSNGATTATNGYFSKMDRDWLVIRKGQNELWIPQANVLYLQMGQ